MRSGRSQEPPQRLPLEGLAIWIDSLAGIPLAEKLQTFDATAEQAVDFLISRLVEDRERLIQLARERHIWGHHEHGDGLLYEYDEAQLLEETDQELADAVVYCVRRASI